MDQSRILETSDIVYQEQGILVIEKPPVCRTILVREYSHDSTGKGCYYLNRYRLAFPWQVFSVTHAQDRFLTLHLAFRNKPLTQEDQDLYYPNLWNVYANDLRVCLGNAEEAIPSPKFMKKLCETVFYGFWNSVWTQASSLHELYKKGRVYTNDSRLGHIENGPNWKEWVKNTEENPEFATGVAWPCWGVLDTLLAHQRSYLNTKEEE